MRPIAGQVMRVVTQQHVLLADQNIGLNGSVLCFVLNALRACQPLSG